MLSPLRKRAGKRLREPFGKAGLTVGVIALVFAMLGGAYAAGTLTSKQKKEVEKIAKKFQGTGPAGPQGPAGANGKDGAKGDTGASGGQGEKGLKGDTGNTGEEGASIYMVNEAPPNCPAGGFTYEVENSGEENEVCNGEKGETGSFGGVTYNPDAAEYEGAILSPGSTETGAWEADGPDGSTTYTSISFPTPVANSSSYIALKTGDADFAANCTGTIGHPEAAPGYFCLYVTASNATLGEFGDLRIIPPNGFIGKVGTLIKVSVSGGAGYAMGTWAMTGCGSGFPCP